MMPLTRAILAAFVVSISTLACATLMGTPQAALTEIPTVPALTEPPATEVPQLPTVPALTEPPATEAPQLPTADVSSCPVITDQILEANTPLLVEGESDPMDFGAREEENTAYLVTYRVEGDQLTEPNFEQVSSDLLEEQDDQAMHQRLWDYFASLIPLEYRADLAEFSIMTDGQENVLAAVAQTYDDPALWGLEVDFADSSEEEYLTFTLVHEFAHLLTLGPDQVPPSEAVFNNPEDNEIYMNEVAACSNFFPGEGCANSNSYINLFYDRFWIEIYDEWDAINLEEDDDVYYQKLDDFYYNYQDQFLTDYAVTHPAEDIAESFSFFIFSDFPQGDTIAEQKVLFFYNFPELVELRRQIRSNLCAGYPSNP